MSKATHHLHHKYIRHRWQSTRFHQTRGHPRKAALFFSLHSLSSGSRLKRVPKVVRSRHHSLCTFALLHVQLIGHGTPFYTHTFAFPTIIITRNCTCVFSIVPWHMCSLLLIECLPYGTPPIIPIVKYLDIVVRMFDLPCMLSHSHTRCFPMHSQIDT